MWGLCTCGQIPATDSMEGKEFIQVFEDMVKIDAIPLGLQRRPRIEAGNPLPIVYTCPDPQAVISKGDCVYVLASTEWAIQNKEYTSNLQVVYSAEEAKGKGGAGGGAAEGVPVAEEQKVGPMRCPMDHKLKQITTPEDGWGCDLCAADGVGCGVVNVGGWCRRFGVVGGYWCRGVGFRWVEAGGCMLG